MERKITHYVVKPEHLGHFWAFCNKESLSGIVEVGSQELVMLTEAKVLDLWCTPVYEKPRVKGWVNVLQMDSGLIILYGPALKSKESAQDDFTGMSGHKLIGQVHIDQEIE